MSLKEEAKAIWPKKRLIANNITEDDVNSDVINSSRSTVENGASNVHSSKKESSDFKMDKREKELDQNISRDNIETSTESQCGACYIPKRYVITFMLGLGMLLTYSMRTNVGVTVVMILDEAPHEKIGPAHLIEKLPKVNWDSQMIGFLHSVFYIGYIVTQLPGAYFTTVWPCQRLFGLCILISALLNLLLPICIEHGLYVLMCAVRSCQGLSEAMFNMTSVLGNCDLITFLDFFLWGYLKDAAYTDPHKQIQMNFRVPSGERCAPLAKKHGLLYPACYGVLRHWSAPSERSRTVSIVLTSGYAGAITGFPVAGVITHYLGWQYVYYVCGGACVLWYLFWTCHAYEKPSHHTSISDSELHFMQETQGLDVIDYENAPTPWRSILTSLPVIAICFCHFGRHWLFILMLTNEALYLNEFGFNIAQTGFYASLPHIAKVVSSFSSGIIADNLLNARSLSTTSVRRLLTGIGFLGPSMCFIILTFLYEGIAVIIVLTFALGTFGLSTSGWSVNHYDLSTRHASSLVAVSSTVGTIGAIVVPLVVGVFTVNQDLQGWNNVFYTTAGVLAFSGLFYITFGSGDQQQWANPNPELKLVQKIDPLARKPYKLETLFNQSSDDAKNNIATDKTSLVTSKYNHGYGTDADVLNSHLSKKLQEQ